MKRLAVALVFACSAPASKPATMTNRSTELSDDDQLIARVRQAAVGAPLETIEDVVGSEAALHTQRSPLAGLARVDLVADPAFPNETFSLAEARDVVYWKRPVEAHDPRVVGVIVRRDGTRRVFFAIVLPP